MKIKQFNGYKKCSKCGSIFPLIMFTKHTINSDGLNGWCKDCCKLHNDKWNKRRDKGEWARYIKNYTGKWKNKKTIMKKSRHKYYQSEKGKKTRIRCNNKRQRNMKFITLIDRIFDVECIFHHVNNWFVISIPKQIHTICLCPDQFEHREKCKKWIKYFYGIDVELFLKEE